MRKLILIAVAGAAAELIDGTLGMGFGVTASTVLIVLAGLGPAQASAIVHTAELGTTLASGVSHWKFGNVDWGVVLRLGVPGAIGAFLGATLLSRMSTAVAAPVTAGCGACSEVCPGCVGAPADETALQPGVSGRAGGMWWFY